MVIRYNLPPPDSLEEITVQHAMPIVGSYVVFSIDVLATLESLDLHADPTTRKLAQEIRTHKYVAYVEQTLTIDVLSPWRALSLRPLHSAPPNPSSGGSSTLVDPDMYLPVLPSTSHPHSRRPLRPTKPLPWPHCYHHTTTPDMLIRVRGGIYADPTTATELPFRDRKRHKATIDMDGERIVKRMLRRRRSMGSTIRDENSLLTSIGPATANGSIAPGWWEDAGLLSGSVRGSRVVEPPLLLPRTTEAEAIIAGLAAGPGITITGPNNETNKLQDEDDEDDDERSVYTEQDHPISTQQNDVHTAELYSTYAKPGGGSDLLHLTAVSVSYDLSEVDEILDPKGFYQELDQLMRIAEEGKERRGSIIPLPLALALPDTDFTNEPLTPITRDHQDQGRAPDVLTTIDIISINIIPQTQTTTSQPSHSSPTSSA
ncbi:hypothetical protein BDN72DRAFT_854270 [Pluteus cervinus]|uniref:Uncharacterized protein n=1 Tax=Pluteus cervinus TaxID=181527 RepID=A0ACD3B921_9AGAR|nr:hypothetical protein BDN72DRAFT_854270 [Pluteus cervinus]